MSARQLNGPGLRWEHMAWKRGLRVVAGVDEVGRGAWAGPIVAAAVVVPYEPNRRSRLTRALGRAGVAVRDSKQMTGEERARVVEVLCDLDIAHCIAAIPPQDIDAMGLGVSNRKVLCDAVAGISPAPDHVLVDAFRLADLNCSHDAIIRGDSISMAIALASIVAKVHRDALMTELCGTAPQFGFSSHKGYGTAQHRTALMEYGVSEHHRRSFRPIMELCCDEPLDG